MTQPTSTDAARLRHIVAVSVAGLLFGLLALLVRVGWTPLENVDTSVAHWFNDLVAPNPDVVRALNAVTRLGSWGLMLWLVALAVIVLASRRQARLAAFLVVSAMGAAILDPGLKALIGRLRPEVPSPVAFGEGSSFPSGHTLNSFICYGALVLVFLPALSPRGRRVLIGAVATLLGLIGLTRVMLGVHYVSDVVGAWCVGVAWLGLTVFAFELYRSRHGQPVSEPLAEGLEPEAAADVSPTGDAPPGRGDGILRLAALVLVGLVLTFGLVVGWGELIKLGGDNLLGDRTIPQWFADHRTPGWDDVSFFWSQAGNTHAIMAVGLISGALALGLIRRWRPVLFLVTVMFGELALFLGASAILGRDRPAVTQLDGKLPTSAYPSGHIAATLCLYAALALLIIPRFRAWWRWLALVPAVLMPVLVMLSRFYRGMHHPTDAVGSLLLAAAWVGVCYLVIRPNHDVERGTGVGGHLTERGEPGGADDERDDQQPRTHAEHATVQAKPRVESHALERSSDGVLATPGHLDNRG
ncbi:phosphatase PAP2 family protein [Luedemannella helvata]|uniref:Phosphatidic acid phosphatase type 2/haloperoxidase domain-containing protein n=1 Tax=Luedemannella helvata TaxID=349315 RepID=A0ABN2KIT2_9ACTN